jgi:two-component system cell cycle sensor histidine kinase/response regulator CckA
VDGGGDGERRGGAARLLPSSLRARLLGLVLLAIVPALAAVLWTGLEQRRDEQAAARREAVRLAGLAAAGQAAVVQGTRDLLIALAELPDVRTGFQAGCEALLARLLPRFPEYANLGVIRGDGHVGCSAVPAGGSIYVGDRPHFRRALATGDLAPGTFQIDRITRRPTLDFGYPVRSPDGTIASVVFAAVDLGFLARTAASAQLPEGAVLTVLDSQGTIVARFPDAGGWVGREFPDTPAVHLALSPGGGRAETRGVDGVRRLEAFHAVEVGQAVPLHVAIGIPTSVAYAQSRDALIRNLAGLAVAGALALLAAWLVGSRAVLRPVSAILAATRRLSAGELEARTGATAAAGELGELARAFDSMAGGLERQTAELRGSAEQYRLLFEGNPSPMWVFDPETLAFLAVNDAAVRDYGYSREEFLAMTIRDIRPEEDVPELEARVRATGEHRRSGGWRHRTKDGTVLEVEIASSPIAFAGRPGRLVLVTDVTERKGLEAQLSHSQRLEAMGRLAGGVAHDFNNLLTAIGGYAEFLREGLADSALERDVEEIRRAVERAAALTRQLVTFGSKQPVRPSVLDLNDVVAATEDMLRRLIGEDVELVTRLDAGIALVKADPGQLEQVIVNLAVNARDAMPGGGKLTIETASVVLGDEYARTHAEARAGPHVMLAVSDTGHGMDRDVVDRIFEPFFTTKEEGKGSGLGLATVYGIVRQSGGNVWVYSEPGRGTTFKIYLPEAGAEAVDEPASVEAHAPARRGSETILLVEDDDGVREVARTVLGRHGYTLLEAASAGEARRASSEHEGAIDLLLTDVVVPSEDGGSLAERLAAERPGLRVLFMSGYAGEAVAHHGFVEFEAPFIEKPFTPEALARKVGEVLEAPPPGAAR